MPRKGSEEDSRTPTVARRKREERNSSESSPDIPPTKSAKTLEEMSDDENGGNVWIVLNKIRRNTDELLEENRALRKQYEELKQSIEFNNSKVESLEQENKNLKEEVKSLKKSLSETKDDVDILYEDLGTAITQLDDLEQYTRKHNLEIHGIAETADENIAESIIKLGKIVNVHISPNDIDICHRMATPSNSGPKPTIVRFKSHKTKSELYKARKYLKSVSLNQYFHATNIVYINENLTILRRKLFAKVRKFKKDNHWQSAWTIDGKIFIKKSQQDQPKRILVEEDLRNIS